MTLAGLGNELSPLTIELGREVERQLDEGSFHAGSSATVRVVAVRPWREAGAAETSLNPRGEAVSAM
jgi:hypothetical protein